MTDPLVSVVVPVFNREALLPRDLDIMVAQIHEHFEHVVAGNAGTEASTNIAHEYGLGCVRGLHPGWSLFCVEVDVTRQADGMAEQ